MIGESAGQRVGCDARRRRIGLVAIVLYILFAAGLGNVVDSWTGISSGPLELIFAHVPMIVTIVTGLAFVKWAGCERGVWRAPVPTIHRVRQWRWVIQLAIPAIMLVQSVAHIAAAILDEYKEGTHQCLAMGTERSINNMNRRRSLAIHVRLSEVPSSLLAAIL